MYDVIIGLEIHAQLKTKSKMFCRCSNDGENQPPNTTICEVCVGHPGTLPTINQKAVEWTILIGMALNCQIADFTKFDRKNYFYPDLAKGYQISQYDLPLTYDGFLEIDGQKIKIVRIHLEEDTGKLLHPQGANYSLIDYNRSGTPLIELVTAPDIRDAQTAKKFCQEYQKILRYLNISDADMEKGQMRCEANVSLQEKGRWEIDENGEIKGKDGYKLNPKVELKNINSFRAMEKAIEYEIKRQEKVLQEGGKLQQETRGWNDVKGCTYHQRLKESANDYRYFPEPDLPPLDVRDLKEKLKNSLPELPQKKKERFMAEYGFNSAEAEIITAQRALADYTEKVVSELRAWLETALAAEGTQEEIWEKNKKKAIKLVSSWIVHKLGGILTAKNISVADLKITPENFAEFLTLLLQNKINNASGLKILEIMVETGRDPSDILEEGDFLQIQDEDSLAAAVEKAIQSNEKAVAEYRAGKVNAIQYLVGQVMKETKGKADPQLARQLLEKKLNA